MWHRACLETFHPTSPLLAADVTSASPSASASASASARLPASARRLAMLASSEGADGQTQQRSVVPRRQSVTSKSSFLFVKPPTPVAVDTVPEGADDALPDRGGAERVGAGAGAGAGTGTGADAGTDAGDEQPPATPSPSFNSAGDGGSPVPPSSSSSPALAAAAATAPTSDPAVRRLQLSPRRSSAGSGIGAAHPRRHHGHARTGTRRDRRRRDRRRSPPTSKVFYSNTLEELLWYAGVCLQMTHHARTLCCCDGMSCFVRLFHSRVRAMGLVRERTVRFKSYPPCVVAKELVDFLLLTRQCATRAEAVELGRLLVDRGYMRHVSDESTVRAGGVCVCSLTFSLLTWRGVHATGSGVHRRRRVFQTHSSGERPKAHAPAAAGGVWRAYGACDPDVGVSGRAGAVF